MMDSKNTEKILKGIEENKKLLFEIIKRLDEQQKKIPYPFIDQHVDSYPSSESGMHCDIERCKKTDAKHYKVRMEDGNGNLEVVEKNYCSIHFHEAQSKGVEFLG